MNRLSNLLLGDRVIWFVYFALCAISVVEVFSAVSTLTYKSGDYIQPILRHSMFVVFGFIVVFVVHRMPMKFFKLFVPIGMVASVILLVMLLCGLGIEINEGARWINFFGIPIQPSEIAKGTLVMYTALVLSYTQTEKGTLPGTFKMIFIPTLLFCGLIFPENFSTAGLLFIIIVIMMFIGRVSLMAIGKLLSVVLITGLSALYFVSSISDGTAQWIGENVPVVGKRVPTWKNRICKHLDKDTKALTPQSFNIDEDAQIGHSKIAIASSNIIGKGPGNSTQRDFLPQAYSDFIYAVIVEELGLIGAAAVVVLYLLLLFRVGYIARRFTDNSFPPFLAIGLAVLLVVQAMVNMLVATGIFPVTGQPLPLISRGGSSMLVNSAYIGILLSVSRLSKKQGKRRLTASAACLGADEEQELENGDTEDSYVELDEEIPPAEQTAKEIAAGNFGTEE